MSFFVITNSDGSTFVDKLTEEELLNRLKPEESDGKGKGWFSYYGMPGFVEKLKESETNSWGNKILIIKGEIIVPKPKKIVEEYEV